jgi:ammonia channel protein AmtB
LLSVAENYAILLDNLQVLPKLSDSACAVTAAAFGAAMVLMYAVEATATLRVSAEGEREGQDLHEHGSIAYLECQITGSESVPGLAFSLRDSRPERNSGASLG